MDKCSKEESHAMLIRSVKRGDTEFVKGMLLSCSGVLNEPSPFADDQGRTALGIAALFGHAKIVGAFLLTRSKVLVNKGNSEGITPLMDACSQGHVEVVRLLCDKDILSMEKQSDVNACAIDGTTALFEAAGQGNVEVLRILCNAGAEVNQKALGGCVALHAAAWKGNLLAGRYLVSRGGYILKSDHDAVAKQFFHVAKKLVSPSHRHKNHVRKSGKFY